MDYVTMFGQFVAVMVAATAGVWGLTEILGRSLPVKKVYLALMLGPLTGLLAWGAGWLPNPAGDGNAIASAGFAALMGLMCTAAAKGVNDKLNPLKKQRPGKVRKGGGLPG